MELKDIKRMKEIGEEYDRLLNETLNLIFKKAPNCLALELTDSLSPVFSVDQIKTKALLAFRYRCQGKDGYIAITEEGKIVFEDTEGNINELGDINT